MQLSSFVALVATLFAGSVAAVSFDGSINGYNYGHSNNDNSYKKCITKPEANAVLSDFHAIFRRDPGWQDIARKITTPDFVLKSGSITSLHGDIVGDGDAVVFSSQAEWIADSDGRDTPDDRDIETLHLDVVGCGTIIEQRKMTFSGRTVLGFERLELRYLVGKWVVYLSEREMDTLAWVGGYTGCCSGSGGED